VSSARPGGFALANMQWMGIFSRFRGLPRACRQSRIERPMLQSISGGEWLALFCSVSFLELDQALMLPASRWGLIDHPDIASS